jgi:hypothetical protein
MSMGRAKRQSAVVLPRQEYLNEQGLIFGATYESAAVIPDGTPPVAVADALTDYVPSGRPGGRAPHVWLQRGAERLSTIDLFGPHFTLLAGRDGDAWRRAALAVAPSWPPVIGHTIGGNSDLADTDGNWQDAYGIADDGAVLVRPDGYIAWRSKSGSSRAEEVLRAVFEQLRGKVRQTA